MNRRILSATLLALSVATIATTYPSLLRAQAQGNQVVVPRVLDLFYSDAIGAPLPALALSQVSPANAGEDEKTAARRFALGAIPALADSDMRSTDWWPVGFAADGDGVSHTRLQQRIGGLRVFGAEVIVHLAGGNIVGLNGDALVDDGPSLKATLSMEAAAKAARFGLGLDDRLGVESGELLIYNPAIIGNGPSANFVAYHVVLSNAARDESYTALVDAASGKLLTSFNNIESSRNRTTHDSGSSTALPGTQCHGESAPINGANPHPDCLGAHRYSGDTYDYFSGTHSRDGYDGAGATMISSVRYGTTENAFWNGRQTAYGPGFATKDVVAHEWTHAVTSHSARLIYLNQSGALNESVSDIFATMIDNDDFLLGEDLPRGAIRSLSNPNQFGQPAKVSDTQFYCGAADNGGVHRNSGVPNHAAYLMANGGSFNGRTVTSIGRPNTAKVFYRALTTYLTPGSTFLDAYNALNTACTDLQGATGGIPAGSCAQVTAALQAVELNQAVCGTSGAGSPDNFEDDDSKADADAKPVYSIPQDRTFHDTGDSDWVRFQASAGASLRLETTNLQLLADTVLRLYDTNGTSVLAEDDDGGGNRSSRIDYTFGTGGVYYARIVQYSPSVFGANTGYTLRIGPSTTTGGDTYEPDNSSGTATTLTIGTPQTNHLFGAAGDNDWGRFTGVANTVYEIKTENLGPLSDTYLFLYAADGSTILAADDDSGGRKASRILFVAPSNGTYFTRVRHYIASVAGPNTGYDIVVSGAGALADSYEPDNTRATARAITLGTTETDHNFHTPSDYDWLSFPATANTVYTLQTLALQSRADTVLDLFDSAGVLLASNDDSAGGLASTIVHTATASATLFARVRQYNPSVFGPGSGYSVRFTSVSCTGGDANEPDNSIAEAKVIGTDGVPRPGGYNHTCAADVDYLQFPASRNMTYDLRTFGLGSDADTVMSLLDSSGTVLAVNDDGGGALASRILFQAPSDGTFYLAIRHYLASASGANTNYNVSVTGTGTTGTADSYEDDDTQSTAKGLTIGTPHTGTGGHNFHDAGDTDWLNLTGLTAGSLYAVETFNLGSFSDTKLEIYNGSTLITSDDDGGGGLASRAVFTAPGTSVHVKVFHFTATTFGSNTNYEIRAVAAVGSTTADSFEPDNAAGQASTLTTASPQLHTFHIAGDHDWAKFTTVAETTYSIFTANLGSNSDTFLELYQPDGTTLITSNDDGGGGVASRIVHTATGAGDLLVRVRHYNSSTGGAGTNYELRLSTAAASTGDSFEPDNTSAAARTLAVGSTQTGHTFHFAGDLDWVKFNATGGSVYRLETLNLGTHSDTVLDLFDTNATTLLVTNDDSGSSLASLIEWTAPATGTYFVRVSHYSQNVFGTDTNYDFRITESTGCQTGDSHEPDGTPLLANSRATLGVGGTLTALNFGCEGDLDWIRLSGLAANSRYSVETYDLGSTADTVLTLFDGGGNTALQENDDLGDGTFASRVEFFTSDNTNRLIRVRSFSSSATGSTTAYSVRLNLLSSSSADSYEPDDSASAAKQITISAPHGGSSNHNIHAPGDQDWVFFDAPANNTCIFETFNLGSRSDTVIRLFDAQGSDLNIEDDDSGEGLASRLTFTTSTAVRRLLKIRDFYSTTGGPDTHYSLRVSCQSSSDLDTFEPDGTPGQASTLTVNGTHQRHLINPAGDEDYAKFVATAGTSYVIETFDLDPVADTVMVLFDTNGTTELRDNDDAEGSLRSKIVWVAPANGTYFVRIRDYEHPTFGGIDNGYSLRVRTGTTDTEPSAEVTAVPGPTRGTVQLLVRPLRPAESVKVEVLAKPELLSYTGARSLLSGKNGEAIGSVRLHQSAAHEPGLTAFYLEGKQLSEAIDGSNALAVDYQMLRPLPGRKTSVAVRVTLIDASGNVTVDRIYTDVNSLDGQPRISSVNPVAVPTETGGRFAVFGTDFVATPKVFLVDGGSATELRDVQYWIDGTQVQANAPAGMKPGAYKVRVQNPDGNFTDSADDMFITQGGNRCEFTVSRDVLTVRSAGDTMSFDINTGNGCQWVPVAGDSWMRINSPTEGSGTQSVSVTVDADPTPTDPREGQVTISAGPASGTRTVTIMQMPNSAPTISSIAGRSVQAGQSTGAIAFTVTDDDDDAITLSGSSSNTTLVSNTSGFTFGGGVSTRVNSDSIFAVLSRTVAITANAGVTGTTTITITATDSRGAAVSTSFVLTVTAEPVLGPPTGVTASAVGRLITVNWTAPTGELTPTGYRVEAGRSSGSDEVRMDVGLVNTFPITVTTDGTWFVRVRSLRGSVASAPSNEVTLQIGATGAIGPPVNFRATASGTTVTLTWEPPASGTAAGYILLAANIGEIPLGDRLSLVQPGVPPGTYLLRLVAVDAAGNRSAPTDQQTLVVGGTVVAPGAPRALAFSVSANNTLTLTWQAPAGGGAPDTYVIDAGTSAGSSDIASGVAVGNTLILSVPVPEGRYFIRVRAVNAGGSSPASNEVDVLVGNTPRPGAPSALNASISGNTVTLTWAAPTSGGPVATYVIDAGSASGASDIAQAAVGNTTVISAAGVPAGRYFVRVRAVNNAGSSGPSNEVIIDVP